VTPLWTVITLLSVIVAVESGAIIVLTRHGGLHRPVRVRSAPGPKLRPALGPWPWPRRQPWPGPQSGPHRQPWPGPQSGPRRQPWPGPQSGPGPQRGSRLRLDVPPGLIGSQHELILYGFVRPGSGTGPAALRAFTSVAAELPGNERALLVSDGDEARTRAYLAAHGVSVPLLVGPQLLQANDIPGTPYAVVADRAGTVITAGAAIAEAHLEELLGQARQSPAGRAAAGRAAAL
jgi:hypothetical protein